MQAAAPHALYVWPVSGSLSYAFALAKHLGREDLKIVPLKGVGHYIGQVFSQVVEDHACSDHGSRHDLNQLDRVIEYSWLHNQYSG
jgi:hypothetical protein